MNISTDSAILMSFALFFILLSTFFAFKNKHKKLKYLFIFLIIFNIFLIIYDLSQYIFPELINGTVIVVTFSSWAFLLLYGLIAFMPNLLKKSPYFRGFLKGLGIFFIFSILFSISDYLFKDTLLESIFGYLINFYLVWRGVRKYKLQRGWLFLTALIVYLVLPFFYGYKEQVSNRASKQEK